MQALLRVMRGTVRGFFCTNRPSGQMCAHIPHRWQISSRMMILGTGYSSFRR
jgi:hypothetical protein